MLDIKLIRENPELFEKNQERAGKDKKAVDEVLTLDKKWREKKQEADELRAKRNKISLEINEAKKSRNETEAKKLIKEAKEIPDKIKQVESQTAQLLENRDKLLSSMPNIISKHTPKGKDAKDNKEIRKSGKPKKFSFKIKNHAELCEDLGIGNFDESAKVSGTGFYYLKNELAILNQALIRFAVDFMNKKKYEYIETPLMIKKEILAGSEGIQTFANSIYEVKDTDLALIGTAEHALMAMHKDETFNEKELPKKYFSYSMCFRKEIGSHGIKKKEL